MAVAAHLRYLRRLGLVVAGAFAVIAAANLVVDPYGVWNMPAIAGFDATKPGERDQELMFKAAEIARRRPVNLFLGSSRVDYGFDPRHAPFAHDGASYNLGFAGGNIDVVLAYYKDALFFQPAVRHVVIGLDFYTFSAHHEPPATFAAERLERRWIDGADAAASLVSLDALLDSGRAVGASRRDPASRVYRTDGMAGGDDMRQRMADEGLRHSFRWILQYFLNQRNRYLGFAPSPQALADFAEIVRLSRARGIDLTVVMPPEHAMLAEAIRLRGLWCAFWAWKAAIAALTPFWDFTGYNTITTEPLDDRMRLYWDAAHFRPAVGDLVLDRMFGVANPALPADFGRLVTPATLGAWRAETEAAQQRWEAAHPDIVAWVAALRQPAGPALASAACPSLTRE